MSRCCWASASCSSPPGRGGSRESRPNVLLVTLLVLAQHPERRAIVYTTAESTSFRLTPTDTLVFKPSEATSEGKVYVFVDPRKTFQPFLGIGGALTDAAAGTLAELPAAPQEEVITASYDAHRRLRDTLC